MLNMSTQLISSLNSSSILFCKSFWTIVAKDVENIIAIPKTARAKARGQKRKVTFKNSICDVKEKPEDLQFLTA